MAKRRKKRAGGSTTHHKKRRRHRVGGPYITGPYITGHRKRTRHRRRRSMLGGYKWENLFQDTFVAVTTGAIIEGVTDWAKKHTDKAHNHVSRAVAKGIGALVVSPLFGYNRTTDIIAIELMGSAGADLYHRFGRMNGIERGGMGDGMQMNGEMDGIERGGMGVMHQHPGDVEYAMDGDLDGDGDQMGEMAGEMYS